MSAVNNTNSYPNSLPREEGSFPALQFLTFYTEAKYDNLTISDGDGTILMVKSVEKAGIKPFCVSKNFGWRSRFRPCIFLISNSGLFFLDTPTLFFFSISIFLYFSCKQQLRHLSTVPSHSLVLPALG